MMRRILVDYARSRPLIKRDGGIRQVTLNEAALIPHEQPTDLIALDDALNSLAIIDARKSKIVELRFFGGLSVEEAAEVLKVSPVTVMREWSKAKHGSTGNSRRPWITEQDKARSYPSLSLGSPLIYGTRPLAGNRSSLDAALDREAAERAAFLVEACKGDDGCLRKSNPCSRLTSKPEALSKRQP
jgi:hypothetical protein